MNDNSMRQAYLSALKQRVSTQSPRSKTMLPVGQVRNDELSQVLSALDSLPSNEQEQD